MKQKINDVMKRAAPKIRPASPSLQQRLDAWHERERRLFAEIERIASVVRALNVLGEPMQWSAWVHYQRLQRQHRIVKRRFAALRAEMPAWRPPYLRDQP